MTHPPYIPAKETELIFRDGGKDGEQIIRRAVEGLPRFLRPGGNIREHRLDALEIAPGLFVELGVVNRDRGLACYGRRHGCRGGLKLELRR